MAQPMLGPPAMNAASTNSNSEPAVCHGDCHDCALSRAVSAPGSKPSWEVVRTALRVFALPLGTCFAAALLCREHELLQAVVVLPGFLLGAALSRLGREGRWV